MQGITIGGMRTAGAPALVIESLGDERGFRTPWAELATASRNIFSTSEWTQVWWRHFGAGRSLSLRSVRAGDGRTLAVLPLTQERKGPFRLIRFAGYGVADELGPVCAPGDRHAATAALLTAAHGADVLIAERIRSDWP